MAEATRRIGALRELYGDLGDNLHDVEARRELWARIEEEHAELATIMPPAVEPL